MRMILDQAAAQDTFEEGTTKSAKAMAIIAVGAIVLLWMVYNT